MHENTALGWFVSYFYLLIPVHFSVSHSVKTLTTLVIFHIQVAAAQMLLQPAPSLFWGEFHQPLNASYVNIL